MKTINPKDSSTGQLHAHMLGAVGPRPIAFASTVDKDGNPNLSPFSFFNAFGSNPATLIFSPARRVRDNTTKHTLENVKEVPEVVINVVSHAMVEQMSLASTEYNKGVNEFTKSGFTPIKSEAVKPFRVKESPAQFECKVVNIIETGTEGGAGNLIVCEILRMHISEDVLDADGHIDQHKIDLVGRLGGNWYVRASGEALFEVEKPIRNKGIGVDQLPVGILTSKVLTGNNLGQLGNVEAIPSISEVHAYRSNAAIEEILSEGGAKEDVEHRLHQLAKVLLAENKVTDAWKVLLQDVYLNVST
ncbi:MAG: flavin reductase (DIM6/NTAB) family NADH-FMN oxidoreductase RutF [Sphingobacteriales bacterium]|jgi:flavin reductase (DIM6/NTAB) family NADH-FMN oxidoreductase RutF